MTRTRFSALALIIGSATFWLAWFLMPDASANDPGHILEAVSATRTAVWWSIVVQLVSCVAFVPAVFGLATEHSSRSSTAILVGESLALIGAMGMGADAFFHLMAYDMTAEGIAKEAVYAPMALLQTDGIVLLVPLMIPFLIGGGVYARGMWKMGRVSTLPARFFFFALIVAVAGAGIVRIIGQRRHVVALSFLGCIALGYGWIGVELLTERAAQRASP